jgi:hypothetical protein
MCPNGADRSGAHVCDGDVSGDRRLRSVAVVFPRTFICLMNNSVRWIPVGELAAGFRKDNFALAESTALVGKHVNITFEGGPSVGLTFQSATELVMHTTRRGLADVQAVRQYHATSPRPGVFLVDLASREAKDRASLCFVVDLRERCATMVEGELPSRRDASQSLLELAGQGEELTRVRVACRFGSVGADYAPEKSRHSRTDELVGFRIEYTYSPFEQYEHIYLSSGFYTWHCLKGVEAPTADTDRCDFIKIASRLYLFVWREKVIPTLGVVLIDLDARQTTGTIRGYQSHDCNVVTNFAVGARLRVLNVTPR